nr:vegetative cell wall protein gp1-like [Penaeus vannamei]
MPRTRDSEDVGQDKVVVLNGREMNGRPRWGTVNGSAVMGSTTAERATSDRRGGAVQCLDDDVTCRGLQELPDLCYILQEELVEITVGEVPSSGGQDGGSRQPAPQLPPPSPTNHRGRHPPAATLSPQQPQPSSPLKPPISPPLKPPPSPPLQPPPSPPPLQPSPTSPSQTFPNPSLPHTPHSPLPHTPLPHTPLTPHSPLTPLTSQSTLASEASVDSGVASAHSLDLLHNSSSSLETHALRRRAGSSVSSGTSEVWLGSLDGDPAGLEVLPELWPHSESPSAPKHSPSASNHSPSSSHHSPTSPHHSPSSSHHSPSSPHHSPSPSRLSPITCPSPVPVQQSSNHLLLPQETAPPGPNPPPEDRESKWHSSPPRENPKEAFSSVIPLHPSALSPHTGPVPAVSEEGGKNRQNCVITVNSVSSKNILNNGQSLKKIKSRDRSYYDASFCKENQSVLHK